MSAATEEALNANDLLVLRAQEQLNAVVGALVDGTTDPSQVGAVIAVVLATGLSMRDEAQRAMELRGAAEARSWRASMSEAVERLRVPRLGEEEVPHGS
jgi:hypothetical protein